MDCVTRYTNFFHGYFTSRRRVDGVTHGMVKVLVDTKGKLLGAHIVGSHAGELIAPLVFAMRYHHSLGDFSRVIHAYPTMMEGILQTSHRYWQKKLFDSPLPWWIQVVRRR
nr:NAD(P)/FAD-dependent oxidoreductase [Bacilli bacterium]